MTQDKNNNEITKWKREGYQSQAQYDKWNAHLGSTLYNPVLDDIKADKLLLDGKVLDE